MSNYVTMTYGAYNFNPVPQVTLNRDYKRTDDERILYSEYKLGLKGVLTPYPSGTGGLIALMALRSGLASGLNKQGCEFNINYGGQNLLSCHPKIMDLSFSPNANNWVNSIDYNIDMLFKDIRSGEVENAVSLNSVSENWNMDILEDRPYYSWSVANSSPGTPPTTDSRPLSYKLTHSVSAKGTVNYNDCSTIEKEAWQYARDFCSGVAGSSGVFSLPLSSAQLLNYNRTQHEDRFGGQYSIEENWFVFTSGSITGNATEEFNIDIKQGSESDIINISINGTVHGLEQRIFNTFDIASANITQTKYANALEYWKNLSYWNMPFYRCKQALANSNLKLESNAGSTAFRDINILRYDKSIGQNIPNGTITYAYSFNNKPVPCVVGALAEDINFSFDYPQDVFASIPILGRKAGPVLQLMGTRTHYGINMSFDVIVPVIDSCNMTGIFYLNTVGSPHSAVKAYMTTIENTLVAQYSMVVKSSDKINWQPRIGKYSRNVSWICVPCTQNAGMVVSDGTAVSVLP